MSERPSEQGGAATNAHRNQGRVREPAKAYLVKWRVVNECEGIVYADSAAEARQRFAEDGIDGGSATGRDSTHRRSSGQAVADGGSRRMTTPKLSKPPRAFWKAACVANIWASGVFCDRHEWAVAIIAALTATAIYLALTTIWTVTLDA